ncbi:hypothetical protein J3Q64DRAFT_1367724 [Phycomyces blakesleeanus]|uniref:SH3 domain-containing protein n=1 Tax=Phycomyces blakesleeanus TaxID=4837 RepID=A0ABR3AMA4_PHYBL
MGARLKATKTNDRSGSSVAGVVIDESPKSAPTSRAVTQESESSAATPASTTAPTGFGGGGFFAELQARTGGGFSSQTEESTQKSEPEPKSEPAESVDLSKAKAFVALWDYAGAGNSASDLVFNRDDVIMVEKDDSSEDWWFGYLERTQKSGYFPSNYVQAKQGNV